MGQIYGVAAMRASYSFFAAAKSSGSAMSLAPHNASDLPAKSIALCATDVLPMETACQLCAGVSAAHAAARSWLVGAHQLASPTSLDTLMAVMSTGVYGAIIGKAIYENIVSVSEAVKTGDEYDS